MTSAVATAKGLCVDAATAARTIRNRYWKNNNEKINSTWGFFFFLRVTFKTSARSGYQSRYVDARLIVQKEVSSWLVYGSNKNNCIGPLYCEGLKGLSIPSSFHMLSIGSLPNAYAREIRRSIRYRKRSIWRPRLIVFNDSLSQLSLSQRNVRPGAT